MRFLPLINIPTTLITITITILLNIIRI